VEKHGTARQVTTDGSIMRRMRVACWIPVATDSHSEYTILIAFPRQQWLCTCASMLRHKYIACLVLVMPISSIPTQFPYLFSQFPPSFPYLFPQFLPSFPYQFPQFLPSFPYLFPQFLPSFPYLFLQFLPSFHTYFLNSHPVFHTYFLNSYPAFHTNFLNFYPVFHTYFLSSYPVSNVRVANEVFTSGLIPITLLLTNTQADSHTFRY